MPGDVDPTIAFDPEDAEGGAAEFPSEVLTRLAGRHGAFGRYLIKGEVARGGMGAVLRVFDEDLRRHLAMKVILGKGEAAASGDTPAVDPKTLGRFLEEAQITSQLDHPGIVPVHELGLDARGRVYFTMKLVKGRSLKEIFDLVQRGKEGWTVTRALGVIQKICEAMAYAHEKGVIHRDLKPGNVMVGQFGEVYVMDWGLARVLDQGEARDIRIRPQAPTSTSVLRTERRDAGDSDPESPLYTMDGDVVGTPAYMPPEQADGRIEDLGPRSDVYSVGAILYHLLSGRMPYLKPGAKADNYMILRWVQGGPPDPLDRVAREIPAELTSICEAAMAREPAERYASMEALAEDLRAYLEGRVVRAYEAGAWAEAKKWLARNQALAASLAAAIVLLVGGVGGIAYVQAKGRIRAESLSQANLVLAEDAKREAERATQASEAATKREREARWQSYVANVRAAEASLKAGNIADAQRRLASCPEEHRHFEWRHLMLASDLSLTKFEGRIFAFSPDGARLASASSYDNTVRLWTVRLWDVASGEELATLKGHTNQVNSVAFSPDGARLASASSDNTVRLWDAATGEALATLEGHTETVFAVAFSPDGTRLASASADSTVRLWDTASGETLATLEALATVEGHYGVSSVAFSSDGARLASSDHNTIRLWDAVTGDELAVERHAGRWFFPFAFSPDGARLAFGADSPAGATRVLDATTGESLATLEGHTEQVNSVAFSPDGARLASAANDNTVRLWDAASGKTLVTLEGHTKPVVSVAFSLDGARLASASSDMTVRLWDATTGAALATLRGHTGLIESVAFSPDGACLASTSRDGTVRLWDTATKEAFVSLDGHTDWVSSVAYSPDGARLASASADNTVRLWNAATGEVLAILEGHTEHVVSVAFSPDGSRLASGSMDKTVRLWEAATGAALATLEGHERHVHSVAFSPDGARLASASWDTLRLWDAATGEAPATLWGLRWIGSVYSLAFSPDSARLACAQGDHVYLMDATTGKDRSATLMGHSGEVRSVAFSPDGARLASTSTDKTVRDAATGEAVATLGGDTSADLSQWPGYSVTFSPDGGRLASAWGNTVRLWETDVQRLQVLWQTDARRAR